MNKLFTIVTFFILSSVASFGQGSIKGKVVDVETGETVPGANVLIEGTTTGASTDFDGKFSINNLQEGTYTIVVKFISYNVKVIKGISVKNGQPTIVDVTIEESSTDLGEVVVTATMNKESVNSLLVLQKNSATVSDGISSESIKRTPDRSTSDVIKRVSGASIQDNKFAIIRGMNDRYNAAYINGAPLPSSEADRRAFAFDIFPSNFLDNLVIVKTATPDLPGDFAGGVIQINTKSIPEKSGQSISVGASYNKFSTFNNFKTYDGGKYDWLGIDDGTRALKSDVPTTKEMAAATNDDRAEYAKLMNYSWGIENRKALPSFNFQYSLFNVGTVFGKEAGSVFAVTYNNSFNTSFATRREFEEQTVDIIKTREYNDSIYSNALMTSALWNLSYKLNENNQVSIKNIYSINSEDKVTLRKGLNDAMAENWEKSSVRWFTQNNIYSGQIIGDHLLGASKLRLKWVGAYSDIKRNIPNLRKVVYNKYGSVQDDGQPYFAQIQPNTITTSSAGSMFFSTSKEQIFSAKYDFSYNVDVKKLKNEFKIGGFNQARNREFVARLLGFTQYRKGNLIKFDTDLLSLSEDQLFSSSSMGVTNNASPYNGGLKLSEATTPLDSYNAKSILHAGYIMGDSRYKDKYRLIYGARVESYRQAITNFDAISGSPIVADTTTIDILPSVNAVWSVTEKTNIRLAYYKTVSRPEFRELANFNFYDFITDFAVSGNPNLTRSTIHNYDVRYELFPGAGQLISVTGFYKKIINPIEQVANTGSQIRSITYANVASATNIGAELELRFKLSSLCNTDSFTFLSNTTLFSNVSYIKSKVDVSSLNGATADRSLQGQSPVIVNSGIMYNDLEKLFSVSVSYNFVGKRIFVVGSTDEPDIWENPRHMLDFQITKSFLKGNLELKLNVRDALAQKQIFYQDINGNRKFDATSEAANESAIRTKDTDNVMVSTLFAPTVSLGAAFKF
ncbi:MAG: outer membrane beta-barrel protein [Bacteroidetes bacterium]|nr:outer membrane beta-barrel protein [Bacteroidota bacterium]